MLSFTNINVAIEGAPVLRNVSFSLEAGASAALIGRNGAGKTTLLAGLTAQIPLDGGEVCYGGAPVWENEAALGELCFSRELGGKLAASIAGMRVKDYLRAGRLFYPHWDEAYARELIKQFGLEEKKRLNALSKGMMSAVTTRSSCEGCVSGRPSLTQPGGADGGLVTTRLALIQHPHLLQLHLV